MNTKLVIVVIGLVLIAGFVVGFAYASSLAPAPIPAKKMIVDVASYSVDPQGEMIPVREYNRTIPVDTGLLQLETNTTFVKENNIESIVITLHNV